MGNEIRTTVDLDKAKQELAELMKRCDSKKATPQDLADLRAALTKHPSMWRLVGDLAAVTQRQLLEAFDVSSTFKESVRHGLGVMRAELAGEDAPAIERLLAEQAAICWLQLNITQLKYSRSDNQSTSIALADYWERRLSADQRRFLRALETLARVRRLLRSHAVQVNIGAQQVNVVGEAKPGAGHGSGKDDSLAC
jgi:hypothetical protein